MDYIHVRDMEFYGYHGVLPEETKLGQRFRITASVAVELQDAGMADDITYTVNYAKIYEICEQIAEGEPFRLIETVAETIATKIMDAFPAIVQGTRVEVIKPDPPIRGKYKEVAVEITRGKF